MILEKILIFLQNPMIVIVMSIIGSWFMITKIFDPYQKRLEEKQNFTSCRNEVFYRLMALQMACNKQWSNSRIIDFLYGNVSVDHNLKDWKISYMVHYCWSTNVYQKTITTLNELENLAQDHQKLPNDEKTKKSKQLIDSLLLLLKNNKEQ